MLFLSYKELPCGFNMWKNKIFGNTTLKNSQNINGNLNKYKLL